MRKAGPGKRIGAGAKASRGNGRPPRPLHRGPTQAGLFRPNAPKPPSIGVATTVEGEVQRITYENPETGFRVLRVAVDGSANGASPLREETWVGVVPTAMPGARVRSTGRYEKDPKHGYQLRVDTLLAVAPSTLEGLERYLGHGMVKGIGPVWAKRVVAAFGLESLDVLDKTPERLAEVPGLGSRRAAALSKAWTEQRAIGAIMIFLQSHGVSPALAARIHRRWGAHAIATVSRAPYRLALDVWGIGFKTADGIARSLGVGEDAPERVQAGVLQLLHDLGGKGHVFAERGELSRVAAEMLNRDEKEAGDAIDVLAATGHVVVDLLGAGEAAVYPKELHGAEVRVARRIASLASVAATEKQKASLEARVGEAIAAFERKTGVALAPGQREAVELAAKHRILVVTGGPGVGKTTIVRAILSVFESAKLTVRLAAPTGRAAKRMSEATGAAAVTLHRLLEFDPKRREFARSKAKPIDADALIVDESSMLDLVLADALLQGLSNDARLVLVGDVDQLPSVGPGAVLRDVIASRRVPTARLTQIFRQAEGSLIVANAHKIHAGQVPESAAGPDGEFFVLPREGGAAAADTILEVVTKRIPQRFGLDPRRDVQVLTPMHKGEAGAIALNTRLQAALNPSGAEVVRGNRVLRVGDKVMQLRNDYEREVYNGDIGFIERVDPIERKLDVRFDDRKVVYEDGNLDELTLAYATSIHKSQGSEYPAVVVPILTQHFIMLSRNLVYTAVTRGKRLVVLVADPRALSLALAEVRKDERMTRLAERIRALD